MNIFRKKCEYCNEKIDKGEEVFDNVKVPGFIGTKKRAFCCEEHVKVYKKEVDEYLEKSKSFGGSCCG